MVQDVRVSRLPLTEDNRVSMKLTYTGNGASPSVTVVAMTSYGNDEHDDGC
jgi:hypothetical protein